MGPARAPGPHGAHGAHGAHGPHGPNGPHGPSGHAFLIHGQQYADPDTESDDSAWECEDTIQDIHMGESGSESD